MTARQGSWTDELFRIYGVPPQQAAPARRFAQFCHAGDRDHVTRIVTRAMGDGKPFEYEHRLTRGDNNDLRVVHGRGEAACDDSGTPLRLFGTVQDITERKRLEIAADQGQKMESIGRLASGVAHDFNNLLTVINGYSEMLFGDPALDENTRRVASEVKRAGERAVALTHSYWRLAASSPSASAYWTSTPFCARRRSCSAGSSAKTSSWRWIFEPMLGPVAADLAKSNRSS